ncbi:hypothetical protein PC121_g22213 [Phytophthora cactorum]|nr:hypothetical protein PC121_g22213 [Phytophthora cactorum]KAG4041324.1 hypothetical protein PC123_g23161 [Phytophthora cactorum]
MARWLSFFAEYNFRDEYKPGKLNGLAEALSRRPDYELAHITRVTTDLYDRIRMAYPIDESLASVVRFLTAGKGSKSEWLSPRQRSRLHRYEWQDDLLYYYRIQGAMGHYLGSLLPYTDQITNQPVTPKFAQTYIVDPDMQQRAHIAEEFSVTYVL